MRQTTLEIAEAREQLVERQERRAAREAHEGHLERGARLAAPDDLVERARESLEQPLEIVRVGLRRERAHVRDLLVGQVEELAIGPLAADLGDDEVAQVRKDVLRDVRQVEPLLRDPVDDPERGRGVPGHERRGELVQDRPVGHPEHARDVLGGELLAAVGDDLIEQAHRVAHRPGGFAREDGDRGVVGLDLLEREHLAQARRRSSAWRSA